MLEVRAKFDSPEGDHIMLLNVYRMYKAAQGNKVQYCTHSVTTPVLYMHLTCEECLYQVCTDDRCHIVYTEG